MVGYHQFDVPIKIAALYDGLKRFGRYLRTPKGQKFESNHLVFLEIIESFSVPLYAHLSSEPQFLLVLSCFSTVGQPIDLEKLTLTEGKKSVGRRFTFNITRQRYRCS